MAIDQATLAFHESECAVAANHYVASKLPGPQAELWAVACRASRDLVADLLAASNDLLALEEAIQKNAGHLSVLRRMLAPPQSQDQFKLVCPAYSKSSEKGLRPVTPEKAKLVAATIRQWLDTAVVPWVQHNRQPTNLERSSFIDIISTLVSAQVAMTDQRTLASKAQEQAVVEALEQAGWTRLPSAPVSTLADLPAKQFMHKTLFATGGTQPKEVDIACGLGKTAVLAMECKVSNDATNSIKRMDEVLNKAQAWKVRWGMSVETAALLQGVIAPKEMHRLMTFDVRIFWSHRLGDFMDWIEKRVKP